MKALLKEREMEHESLSKEHASIKKDTEYIYDEMKYEKMARENLYKNSTRTKEILETMDLMKEVVLQKSRLTEKLQGWKLRIKNYLRLNKIMN
jgi:hypothetical protein